MKSSGGQAPSFLLFHNPSGLQTLNAGSKMFHHYIPIPANRKRDGEEEEGMAEK